MAHTRPHTCFVINHKKMMSIPVNVEFNGKKFTGRGFQGKLPANNALILILPDVMGCKQLDVYRASVLANKFGCSTVAVDLYGDAFPPALREQMEAIHDAFEHMNALLCDPVYLRALLAHYLQETIKQLKCSATRVGAVGFCFGGSCVLEMVRAGLQLCVAVSFHGVVDAKPLTSLLGKPPPPIKSKPVLVPPADGVHILVCTGRADPLVPPEMVEDFQKEMARCPAIGSLQVNSYGPNVLHAFTTPNREEGNGVVGFNSNASRYAWTSCFDLFSRAFGLPNRVEPPKEWFNSQQSFL